MRQAKGKEWQIICRQSHFVLLEILLLMPPNLAPRSPFAILRAELPQFDKTIFLTVPTQHADEYIFLTLLHLSLSIFQILLFGASFPLAVLAK